jgi:hypothetical protein
LTALAFGTAPGLVRLQPRRGFEEPLLLLLRASRRLAGRGTASHLGLLFELVEVGAELAQDVFDPRQVFARVGKAVFGLATPLFVFGDPGGLFQEQAQLFGPATR